MNDYVETLCSEFQSHANPDIAKGQKAYLKHQFEFFGLKAPDRRKIQKPFLEKSFLPPKKELVPMVKYLWQQPQREFQHFAMELVFRYKKEFTVDDLSLFEFMITHKSWWDTVDFIATNIIGTYFRLFPDQIASKVDQWMASNNMWLQRTALLFQLKYKEKTDTALLENTIQPLLGSREFFINKAIGWALRHYSRTNPTWVKDFVSQTKLSNLSRREALRLMN